MGVTEIDSIQFLIQPDGSSDGQDLRLQITHAPKVLGIGTTPTSASLPLTYSSTELPLLCVDPESISRKRARMS